MMKRLTIIVALSLICLVLVFDVLATGDLSSRFDAANRAHSVGDYDTAIAGYEEILQQEGYAGGLLFNLGNSYAQKGEVGMAILRYEQALRLSPSDPDILGNLSKVRKDSGLFSEDSGTLDRILTVISIDGWSWVVFLSLLLMLALLFIRLYYKLSPRSQVLAWTGASLLLISSVAAVVHNYQIYNPLVVIVPGVKLQISPFDGASSSGSIEEGRLLFARKHHGNYTYVTDKSGRKGWVPNKAIAAICQ